MSFLSLGGKHARASLRNKAAASRQKRTTDDLKDVPCQPPRSSRQESPAVSAVTLEAPVAASTVTSLFKPVLSKPHGTNDGGVPWCDDRRFEPIVLDDVLMNPPKVKEDLFRWMRSRLFEPSKEVKSMLFLRGPSGSCKSTAVRVAARTCGVPCEEPPCFRLRDVMDALTRNVCTRALSLDRSQIVTKRVWLFAGIDGWLSGAGGDTAASDVLAFYVLLSALNAMGPACPPIVFTGCASDHPRMRELRTLAYVNKLFCNGLDVKRPRIMHDVAVAARRVCVAAGAPTCFADAALAAFNGDMKHLMTNLELAARGLITNSSVVAITAKDEVLCINVNDAFQACKFLMQPSILLSADSLAVLFDKYALLPGLLRENGTAGLTDTEETMVALADLADTWSTIDVCEATYWQHPSLTDAMNLVAVKTLRDARAHSATKADVSFMLQLPQKARQNHEILQDACASLHKPAVSTACSTGLARIEEFEVLTLICKNARH